MTGKDGSENALSALDENTIQVLLAMYQKLRGNRTTTWYGHTYFGKPSLCTGIVWPCQHVKIRGGKVLEHIAQEEAKAEIERTSSHENI